ncbi:MAG: hypothetical protein FJY65_10660 [Calditrichaeota bacterium]|nr:hypothetical protein [Calditrichota bacterium]
MNRCHINCLLVISSLMLAMPVLSQPRIAVEPLEIEALLGEELTENVINIANLGNERLLWRIEIYFLDGQGWLAVSPVLGLLPPGSDEDILALIDIRGLNAGDYRAEVHIISNDPQREDVEVAARAEIPSAPGLRVVWEQRFGFPDSIVWNRGFEGMLVGANYTVRLNIASAGNDILRVSEVFSTHRFFTVQPVAFELPPGQTRDMQVNFRAELPVRVAAELVIESNAFENEEIRIPLAASAATPPLFDVALAVGWNLISAPVQPLQNDVPLLFDALRQREDLLLVKDGFGRFYVPARNFCNIPGWDFRQAYLVKMNQSDTLTLRGLAVEADTPIPLRAGWNTAAYFPANVISAPSALRNIAQNLLIAKDGLGNFYIPNRGFNNIPPMRQGRGYQIKLSSERDLIWAAAFPGRLEINAAPIAQPFDDEWIVSVNVRIFDLGDNLLPGEILVELTSDLEGVRFLSAELRAEPILAYDGRADCRLRYGSRLSLHRTVITASVEGEEGAVEAQLEYLLPLNGGALTVGIAPEIWIFDRQRPNERCIVQTTAVLTDARQIRIPDAAVIFESNRGTFYYRDPQQPNNYIPADDRRAITNAQGEATLFLIGVMDDFFLDPFTLDVNVQVSARLEEVDLEADPIFLRIQRNP